MSGCSAFHRRRLSSRAALASEAAERLEILSLVVAFAPGAQGLRFLGRADSLPPVGVLFVAQRCPDEEVAAAAEAVP